MSKIKIKVFRSLRSTIINNINFYYSYYINVKLITSLKNEKRIILEILSKSIENDKIINIIKQSTTQPN